MKTMLRTSPSLLAVSAAGWMAMAGESAFAQTSAPADADAAEIAPGEIIVTARRRQETLLDTPVAVTALTSEDLQARGLVTISEIATNTPGLNIQSGSTGRADRSVQAIALRGFAPTTGTAILVATFIDGVPVASTTALTSIADPERVEILKGPQAAYFGRNTFAGAINVVNKLPGNDFGGSLSGTVGTRSYRDLQGSLEGPLLGDALSFRLSGRDFSRHGSYRNAADPNQRLGDQSTRTGSLLLVAKPTPELTLKAFGLLSEDDDGPAASGALFAYELRANNGLLNIPAFSGSSAGTLLVPNLSNCNYNGLVDGISASEARVTRAGFCGELPGLPAGFSPVQTAVEDGLLGRALADPTGRVVSPSDGVKGYGLRRQFKHFHFNIDYELGDSGFMLSSLTGYNKEQYSTLSTLNNYDTTLIRNPTNPTGANLNARTSWSNMTVVERYTQDFSQEVRLSFDNKGPLTAVVGGSYLFTKAQPSFANVGTEVMGTPRNVLTTIGTPQQSRTIAGFFGLTYEVTERLKINVDARYQRDRIYFFAGARGLTIVANNAFGLPSGTYAPLTVAFHKDFKTFLPRVIAQYDINDDVMAYASFSQGANITLAQFNSSVFNGSPTVVSAAEAIGLTPTIDPERLNNFEIGLKGRLLDGKLRFQLAAYYAHWRDQINQRTTFVIDEAPPIGTGAGTYVTGSANAGDVIMKGLELDITAIPFEGLTLNASGAINDSDIRRFVNPQFSKLTGVVGEGFRGNQLANGSKYSATVGLQYGTAISGWEEGAWFVRGDTSYKSKVYVNETNLSWIPSRTVANFRVGLSRGPFSLEGFVLNAFNNRNYTSGVDQNIATPTAVPQLTASGYVLVGLPDLRTWGMKAAVKF